MATIRKRNRRWQVQVRRNGIGAMSKTFEKKQDALRWARETEAEFDKRYTPLDTGGLKTLSLHDLLARYENEVTPGKKGAGPESYRLRILKRHRIAKLRLKNLTPEAIASYRDDRLKLVEGASVRRELVVLRHCLEVARKQWQLPISPNPVSLIELPRSSPSRERRLAPDEATKLLQSLKESRHPYLPAIVTLALETAMRRGEILSLRWNDIDLDAGRAWIREAKNGRGRTIPLSAQAREALLPLSRTETKVFPISANAVQLCWKRTAKNAGLIDFHFHDLRHEAISRLFEKGLSVPEVSLVSGHLDHTMLLRYAHGRFETVLDKINQ